ncbi:jg14902 [Pararge aegeria aegeria]|uniref:Jg14902 protein n=1 Tax=Pararge aegeria aegeria TaxID=348720 RepID=A0A8S4R635_9NEOP|nr:jg14902 [Pararge aegeria aegeria]
MGTSDLGPWILDLPPKVLCPPVDYNFVEVIMMRQDKFRTGTENCLATRLPAVCVTRACRRASEWGSARKSLNPRARRSEGIVGLRAPHVRPNLGSGDDWCERVTDGKGSIDSSNLIVRVVKESINLRPRVPVATPATKPFTPEHSNSASWRQK